MDKKELIDKFVVGNTQPDRSEVASWRWVRENGSTSRFVRSYVCHATVFADIGRRSHLIAYTARDRPGYNRDNAEKFYAWAYGPNGPYRLLNEVNEFDPALMADEACVFHNIEGFATNYLYNAIIATRFPTEYPWMAAEWVRRVELGVHPALAYWAMFVPPSKENPNSNHQAFDWRYVGEDYVKNLAAGHIAYPLREKFPCNAVWGVSADKAPLVEEWAKLYPDLFGMRAVNGAFGTYEALGASRDETLIEILKKEGQRLEL